MKTIKDLPIYPDENQSSKAVWVNVEPPRSSLETSISAVRQATCEFMQQFKTQKEKTVALVEQTKSNANSQLEYIRSETNLVPKVVFISLSGLSGLLIGFRKSKFRKFMYTTVLTIGATSLCYPKEAKVYYEQAFGYSRKAANDFYREYIWPSETKSLKNKPADKAQHESGAIENAKDKVIKLNVQDVAATKSEIVMKGDKGQSRDEDKDMYTTRSK